MKLKSIVALSFLSIAVAMPLATVAQEPADRSIPVLYAQALPKLTKYMPYSQARRKLINQGWRPVVYNQAEYRGTPEIVDWLAGERGYSELHNCSGTGAGFCEFKFRNSRGKILSVVTVNNERDLGRQSVLVNNWRIER